MNRIYLDTCIFIYFLEEIALYYQKAKKYFDDIEVGKYQLIASPLIVQEILAGVYKKVPHMANEIYSLLISFPNICWKEYNLEVADFSAQITAKYNLKSPDAIHLASAILNQANQFITSDLKLITAIEKVQSSEGHLIKMVLL